MLARAPPRPCYAGAGDRVRCRHEVAPSRRPWAVPGGLARGGHRRAGARLAAAAAASERRTAAGLEPVAAAPPDGTKLANGSSAVAGM